MKYDPAKYVIYRPFIDSLSIFLEITSDRVTSKHSAGERVEFDKSDSVESTKSSKISSEQSAEKDAKYSARMDKRDGYREDAYPGDVHPPHHNRDHSNRDKTNDRKTGDSRSKQGASPSSANMGRDSSPKHSKSVSPSSRNSPRTRDSPRSRNSPRNSDRSDRQHDHQSPRDHRRSSTSPHREHAGRHHSRSPIPSPNSKSKAIKSFAYAQVEPLELSKLEREQSDVNYAESDDDSITGEINPPVDDSRIRLFVALFDYDPETMSPNVDALDEELPFREGQIIKVSLDSLSGQIIKVSLASM